MRRISFVAFLIVFSMCCVFAAAQNNASMANSGGAQGTSDIGKDAHMDTLLNQQVGSIRFYGKVSIEGLRALWDPILVTVTCNNKVVYNTNTDPSGGFNIEAAPRRSEVVTEKADLVHITPAALVGCQVSAALDGFKSSTLTIANASLNDNPAIGTISLTLDHSARGSVLSPTTTSAPADAIKEFEKAHDEQLAHHADAARKHLQKAVAIDPQFAEAWFHLGAVEEKDKPDDALGAFNKAVAVDSGFIPPYVHIAALAANRNDWKSVIAATQRSLELNPAGSPEVWYFDALGKLNSGKTGDAETSAMTSLAMDPNHLAPKTEQLLAVIQAGHGEYGQALQHLRNCLTYTPPGPDADLIKKQIAQLQTLDSGQSQK
jgi:tetratricopeptide (TPR) repeat protein